MRIAAFLMLFPGIAAAQTNDLEYRQTELEDKDKKLEVSGQFETQWHEWNNLDFRPLETASTPPMSQRMMRTELAKSLM